MSSTGPGIRRTTGRAVGRCLLQRPERGERGGATLFAVACAGVLLLVGSALGVVAALVVAHRTAEAAADFAALAAAGDLVGGDPCARAEEVAAANRAALSSCEVLDRDVLVEVVVVGPRWLGQDADLVGRARAGPAP